MPKSRGRTFGRVIRERRRQLDLTQQEVARRIDTSTPYVGHLESGQRRPSDKIVIRIADVLGLDCRELYLLAKPEARELLEQRTQSSADSIWESFRKDKRLHHVHNITREEMELLSRIALLGDVRSERDFVYVLNAVRHALGR